MNTILSEQTVNNILKHSMLEYRSHTKKNADNFLLSKEHVMKLEANKNIRIDQLFLMVIVHSAWLP